MTPRPAPAPVPGSEAAGAFDPPTVALSAAGRSADSGVPESVIDQPTAVIDAGGAPTEATAATARTVRLGQVGGGRDRGLHDGLALSLSSVLSSLAGFLGWLIAARIMPTSEVGDASLVVSAFILVAGAAQLNLGVGLLRWLPAAGRQTSRLMWGSLLLIMPLSGFVGLVYALVVPRLATISAGPDGSFGFGLLLFVLAAAGWGVFVVHDFVVVALGKPWWAVWRNGLFVVVRLGLLVLLGGIAGLGAYGMVLSWVGPIVVWIAAGSAVLAVLARRVGSRAAGAAVPSRGEAVRFLGPTATAQIGLVLLYQQIPVMVNLRFGAETGAVFFVAWQAVTVVDLAAMFFMNSLVVGVAREPHRAAQLAAAARKRLLLIFLPLLAVGAVLAEPALLIFGADYAQAADVLRLLLLGLAFRLVVAHELGVRQAVGQAMGYARLQLISTVLVLVAAVTTPVSGAGVSALLPVAIGYVVVQVVCAAAVLFRPARRRSVVEVPSR